MKIALGTAAIGRPHYINLRQEAPPPPDLDAFHRQGVALLDEAYERGIRYFDTAPNYGLAEQWLVDWAHHKGDPTLEIATKWGYTYTANFNPKAVRHEHKEHSLEQLNRQWKKSQKLLPYLSTYQIHSATFDTGVLDNDRILNRLAALKEEHGLLIGITTTGLDQAEVAKKALDVGVGGQPLFDVFQLTFNVLDQSMASLAPTLAAARKRVVIKEAMANGRIFSNPAYPQYAQLYTTLEELAGRYGVGVDAVALRFCIDSFPLYMVLSGASRQSHLHGNLKAANFRLTEEEQGSLKALAVSPSVYWSERKKLGWQ